MQEGTYHPSRRQNQNCAFLVTSGQPTASTRNLVHSDLFRHLNHRSVRLSTTCFCTECSPKRCHHYDYHEASYRVHGLLLLATSICTPLSVRRSLTQRTQAHMLSRSEPGPPCIIVHGVGGGLSSLSFDALRDTTCSQCAKIDVVVVEYGKSQKSNARPFLIGSSSFLLGEPFLSLFLAANHPALKRGRVAEDSWCKQQANLTSTRQIYQSWSSTTSSVLNLYEVD